MPVAGRPRTQPPVPIPPCTLIECRPSAFKDPFPIVQDRFEAGQAFCLSRGCAPDKKEINRLTV